MSEIHFLTLYRVYKTLFDTIRIEFGAAFLGPRFSPPSFERANSAADQGLDSSCLRMPSICSAVPGGMLEMTSPERDPFPHKPHIPRARRAIHVELSMSLKEP